MEFVGGPGNTISENNTLRAIVIVRATRAEPRPVYITTYVRSVGRARARSSERYTASNGLRERRVYVR